MIGRRTVWQSAAMATLSESPNEGAVLIGSD
jgi:hypothetical protein